MVPKFYSFLTLAIMFFAAQSGRAQTLSYLFTDSQSAGAQSEFYGGTPQANPIDVWSGSFNLASTGVYSGSSALPNPGLGSSASSAFLADLSFGASLWDLTGTATATIDTGAGNSGSVFPTIASFSGSGAALTFSVDSPFVLSLQSSLSAQFVGNEPSAVAGGRANTRLFAILLDGVLTNQYLADWDTINGSTGGFYAGSWNSGLFRLEFNAGTNLASNIPNAFGTQTTMYDTQLSVSPIPEPSGALLALLGGGWFLGLRRRKA